METYVLLSTLTPKGRETLNRDPDRLVGVNKEIEALGCKVLAQWATLGGYDFVTVIQAPDNATVARLSVELGKRGTTDIRTLPAITTIVFRKKLKETVVIRPRRTRARKAAAPKSKSAGKKPGAKKATRRRK